MELFRTEIKTIAWTLWIFVGCAALYLWLLTDPYTGLLFTVGIALTIGSIITAASALAGLLIRLHAPPHERLPKQTGDDR